MELHEKRRVSYVVTAGLLLGSGFLLRDAEWQGNIALHTLMEVAATLLAFFVGAMALVRFFSRRDPLFLYIGAGFLGTAMLDGYHAVVTSVYFQPYMPSDNPHLVPWSWIASRLFLSVLLFISWLLWFRHRNDVSFRPNTKIVMTGTFVATLAAFLFFATVPLPSITVEGGVVSRPVELLPAAFFLMALVGYLYKGAWRDDQFEHWLVLSLIVGLATQTAFMPFSDHLYDTEFNLAHLLKKLSYILVLNGLLVTLYLTYKKLQAEEEELLQASVYARSLIEASLDPLVTISPEGKITDVNQATEQATGYSRDELVGTDFFEYFTDPDKAREGYQQVFAKGSVTDYPLALRHRDGHVTDVLYNASVYRGEGGEVLGVFAAARDVTERKKAEQEVAQLSLRNKLILDSAGEGIYGLSIDGRCTFVNPTAVQLLGFSAAELVGEHAHYKFHHTRPDGSHYPEEECPVQTAYRQGEVHRGEDLYWRKDGSTFPVEFISTPILDAGKITGAVVSFLDISERKKAEFILRQSEEGLKEAQRIAHLGSWYLDLATNQVFWSEELYKIYGLDPALPPPLYTESAKLFTPESWERLSAAITHVVETGIPYELELETVQKDGGRGWMLARGELVRDASGAPVRVRGVVMDITARKKAEEQLRRSEHGLAEAQRIAHLGNWELDLKTNALTWSDEIYRIFEIDKKKFGASYEAFLNAIHPDDREMVNKSYSNSVANWGTYDIVHRLQMPDGRIKYVNEKCETYYDEDGKPLRSVGTVHDITERVLDEQALRQLNRELRAISNCNEALMRAEDERVLLDEICRIICDDAGYRMAWVGYAENDEARTIRPVAWAGAESGYLEQAKLTWADTERGRGPSGLAIRTGESVGIQDFSTDPNAALWRDAALQRGYRSSISLPIKDESATVFGILNIYANLPNAFTPGETRLLEELAGDMAFGIMVLRARIERRRAEAEIRKLNLELEQRVAERTAQLEAANKELEAFSYSVSHDLRTPLRAIDGFSHILQEDYAGKLDEEGQRLLNVVRDNTARMGQLIDDILKFSRAGRLELTMTEIDMEAMARDVFEELQPVVDENKLQLEIEPLPLAQGDRAMMRQVFVNLLSNAIKFSRLREPARIRVGARIEGDEVVYYVQDNGAGFDMQYAGKLFGVFQRLHGVTEFEGTGIGLAIVKRIVTRHGGRVWAEGKVDQGATMYFALPAKGADHG